MHGFILTKLAAVPRPGAGRSLPLSARENADLMDFLSFIRWLAGQGEKRKEKDKNGCSR